MDLGPPGATIDKPYNIRLATKIDNNIRNHLEDSVMADAVRTVSQRSCVPPDFERLIREAIVIALINSAMSTRKRSYVISWA
jgi:hypothetical protein